MIALSTPRPGKTQALNPDNETLDLKQLYAYGQSVNKGWRPGPTVLLIKNKSGPKGERTQSLSVTPKNAEGVTTSASDAAERLVRTLARRFIADRPYPTEVKEALDSIWSRVTADHQVVLDTAFLKDLKVLIDPPSGRVPTTRTVLRALGHAATADQVKDSADIPTIADLIRSLEPLERERFKYRLNRDWGHEASTQQLLAALNAQAPARHGPHETTRRVEREQALALGDLPYTRRTSPDPMRFIELSDPPATTADASPPRLGQAFVDIFGQRLKGLGISNFLTVTPDTTVKELAQFTAMLDNEALESFRFTLQWVEQGRPLEPGLKNTPQARLTARLLMEAMETVC
ncbi:hypothetical protein [Hydrogenophaga sp.]|uniref:hypothetical protein n=2 Tax=unclassified Hydrogenophaga TaxID=2610897 RepID=UPI001AD18CB6|nr:hypothetical protein [Hydrogenophaga sp.]MBN9370195.1 hypothetical protein [Hydrogenophaga sp.]